MNPETFVAVADAFDGAVLLLSAAGVVEAANREARTLIVDKLTADLDFGTSVLNHPLADLANSRGGSLESFLQMARRTSSPTIGSIQFNGDEQRYQTVASRICNGDHVQIILRIETLRRGSEQFSILNEKIDQLNHEIARRRMVERQLRAERDVAEFGRDIGIALVHSLDIQEALTQCTQLMVQRLDAAFARIWLANDQQSELHLVASSGAYTHTDGAHGRIRFGEFKIGRIAENQQPHITNAVIGDPDIHDQQWATREGMVAFIGLPLVDNGVTVGVVGLFARHELSDSVAAAIGSVANSIALRIHNHSIEEGLKRQTLALKDADRRKDEFLAMLSHELRNPLAPVRSGLDLLSLHQTEHHDTIEMMQQQVQHLVRLVDDLLDVSRIMRGRVELRRQPTELTPLIEHACETLRDAIDQAGHTLAINVPDVPVWINADTVRVIQIIENLLKNACKYTDSGGEIAISASTDQAHVMITIADNGIGIDGELMPQIFDLFTQSQRSLDRSQGGLGIGLTLVKNLVEMHRGSVSAQSDGLGFGSKFSVRFPTCATPADASRANNSPAEVGKKPLRILAVDDNRAAHVMLTKLFQKLGPYEVKTAEDGSAAISLFQEFHPDLVLLDIGLPGMSGYEIARAIRDLDSDNDFLLVALTGYGQKDDRTKAMDAGFDVHIVKPPSVDQLRQLLNHPIFLK